MSQEPRGYNMRAPTASQQIKMNVFLWNLSGQALTFHSEYSTKEEINHKSSKFLSQIS